ncbi:MAG: adenylate kinase [bacterium]|nr:adenylate kinase [bacterium]
MILLIGGSSHVGKTLLSQKLMEKYHWPYLSLDHLKMGLIRRGMTELTVEDDYEMRYFLFPLAAEMIKTAVENRQNMIVEGCYIPGEWREQFPEEYLREIRCVFLVMSEGYLRAHFSEVCSQANIIEHRLSDEPDLERLIRCSDSFREDCCRFGIPCLEIDGEYNIDDIMARAERLMGLV